MRGIEAEDIDAGLKQSVDGAGRIAGGAESGYDLGGPAAESHLVLVHHKGWVADQYFFNYVDIFVKYG